jgi:CheY-like chemotaxis protein
MLLDFQMPVKNGLEVVKEVKALYLKYNSETLDQELDLPEFVFLTAFVNLGFKAYLKAENIHHIYEKPLAEAQLIQIMSSIDEGFL